MVYPVYLSPIAAATFYTIVIHTRTNVAKGVVGEWGNDWRDGGARACWESWWGYSGSFYGKVTKER